MDEIKIFPEDEHNRRLLQNTHPPGWVNPVPSGRYNLVVIGAGTAGLVTAAGAAGLGAKVALVEKHLMGGDCLNYGCVPSKALIRAARACAEVRAAGVYGIRVPAGVRVDFPAVMERMRKLRAQISPNDSAERFRSLGVDVFLGAGRFSAPNTVEVGGQTLRFKKAVIATGARAVIPEIPGLAQAQPLTNETIFSLTELPRRLAVIGAGPIGCEMAQTFRRFGAEVHLIDVAPQILPREDADASDVLQKIFLKEGVVLHLGVRVLRVERSGNEKILMISRSGPVIPIHVDAILVGVGRAPNVEGMDLDSVGVQYDKTGVRVDDRLRTANSDIFAAGDVCSAYKFTHAADFYARIVIQNALFFGRAKAGALTIPWCTYTDPEVAHVGVNEKDALARGIETRTFVQPLAEIDRAILDGQTDGFVKIWVRKNSDEILGATIVAAHAGEMMGEIALAMTTGAGLARVARTIHPYPTHAESIRRAGDTWNRTRLTPRVKKLFSLWLGWTR